MNDALTYTAVFIGGVIAGFASCAMFSAGVVADVREAYDIEIHALKKELRELKAAKVIKKVVRAKSDKA